MNAAETQDTMCVLPVRSTPAQEGIFDVPRLLQIGSTSRNAGKTTLAKKVIEKYKADVSLVALKIITITGKRGVCQRGGAGCGICTSISQGYELTEEFDNTGSKDTMQLLAAGASRVFLLKAFKDSLQDGFCDFLMQLRAEDMIICESNTLREFVHPGLFLMAQNGKKAVKPTAQAVLDMADRVLVTAEVDDVRMNRHSWFLA